MRAERLEAMPEIRILTVLRNKDGVVVRAAGSGSRRCPDCGTLSASCKGRYVRRLQDLSVQGRAVRLEVHVTRWRCRNPQCARQSSPQIEEDPFKCSKPTPFPTFSVFSAARQECRRTIGPAYKFSE